MSCVPYRRFSTARSDTLILNEKADRLLPKPVRAPMKITPVLVVNEIETAIPFWVNRLGFEKIVEVPEGDKLGFVILTRDGAELMLQTRASVEKDTPQFTPASQTNQTALFIEVDDFEDILKRLADYPIAMPERVAFYGMREIGVFDPSGHVIVFAARTGQ